MVSPVASPAFAVAVAGIRDAQSRIDQAAQVIAKPGAVEDTVTLSEAVLTLNVAQHTVEANVKVIAAEDAMLDALTRANRSRES